MIPLDSLRLPRLVLVLAALLFPVGCGGGSAGGGGEGGTEESVPRNLLLVTFDTTRADHIGAYGYAAAETPNVDGLAAAGVLFEECISPAPLTLPAHSSLLSGLSPDHHGARNNGTHTLPDKVRTLAEILHDSGFHCGAVVSSLVLDSRYGLAQGFDEYDDDLSASGETAQFMLRETKASDTLRRARKWLERRGRDRWFLWVHFFDPHAAYLPPEPYVSRHPGRPYDGEIAAADAALGSLLADLRADGELDRTLVVFTADHGESLKEHGESTHSFFLYDATTHVPLVMCAPSRLPAGRRVAATVGIVDVLPTVLDLLGVPADSPARVGGRPLDGVSLAACARGEVEDPRRPPLYQESMTPYYSHAWAPLRALRGSGWRYVEAPREEYYDLRRDPGEIHDLLAVTAAPDAALRARVASLRAQLDARRAQGEEDSRRSGAAAMSGEERAQLAELGYVTGDGAPGTGAGAEAAEAIDPHGLPDPKDRIRQWQLNLDAYNLVRERKWEAAEKVLNRLRKSAPGSVEVRKLLSRVYEGTGRMDAAVEVLRECLGRPGVDGELLLRLAGLERSHGGGDWQALVASAQDLDPLDPTPWSRQGDWLQADGDTRAAVVAYRRALELDPDFSNAWYGLGQVQLRLHEAAQAVESFHKALAGNPGSFEAEIGLARADEALGRTEDAERAYRRALESKPGNPKALVGLGNLAYRAGRLDEAERAYRAALSSRPDHFEANANLGTLLLERGDRPAALPFLRHALRLHPTDPHLRSLLH